MCHVGRLVWLPGKDSVIEGLISQPTGSGDSHQLLVPKLEVFQPEAGEYVMGTFPLVGFLRSHHLTSAKGQLTDSRLSQDHNLEEYLVQEECEDASGACRCQ